MPKKKQKKGKITIDNGKNSNAPGIQAIENTKWEDENYEIKATVLKTQDSEGISIKTKKKTYWRENRSFYIQKDQAVGEILNWIFVTVKRFFAKFWNKEIITESEIKASNKVVEDLRDKLRESEEENRKLKQAFTGQQQELELAKEAINNSNQYAKELDDFEKLVIEAVENNKNIEEKVKNELKAKRWILGLDCEVKAKNKDIDLATQIDLHIETNYGEQRIIEAKSPNIPLFTQKIEGGRLNLDSKISEGLSEIIEYMRRTDINSGLKRKGIYEIQKPIGRILAGYKLSQDEQEVLNDWNFYLGPYIKFITYKELISNAKKEIELIVIAKELFDKSKK